MVREILLEWFMFRYSTEILFRNLNENFSLLNHKFSNQYKFRFRIIVKEWKFISVTFRTLWLKTTTKPRNSKKKDQLWFYSVDIFYKFISKKKNLRFFCLGNKFCSVLRLVVLNKLLIKMTDDVHIYI